MKSFVFLFIVFFSSNSFSNQDELDFKAWERKGSWGIYNKKPDGSFNPLKIKDYREGYLPSFSYLINKFGFGDKNNTYCLIGYQWNKKENSEERTRVVVFWKNANYLIDWDLPDGDTYHRYKAIIFSKPFINLNESVVPYKEAEGAQALWAKEGIIQMINDCELHGEKITIKPSEVMDIK
ncbi:hypothetical protein [Xenorhabdus innexi]|uniref:Uncharacterized protein n=1 Tax=Xenorhabdus innexi TaxID=290109 RepID=A0A1N6MRA9_9GAMM|nr:hypothetical protein [Xenorhabdus innexi]PHM35630.1 hypothetical protein Xinn_02194 [Xenorhabdus innexi]SIP71360.1 conserved exported hypothetical protein [Xenorhabdus innexi]